MLFHMRHQFFRNLFQPRPLSTFLKTCCVSQHLPSLEHIARPYCGIWPTDLVLVVHFPHSQRPVSNQSIPVTTH